MVLNSSCPDVVCAWLQSTIFQLLILPKTSCQEKHGFVSFQDNSGLQDRWLLCTLTISLQTILLDLIIDHPHRGNDGKGTKLLSRFPISKYGPGPSFQKLATLSFKKDRSSWNSSIGSETSNCDAGPRHTEQLETFLQ